MAIIFSDDFNRSDSTTVGNNWVEQSGDWAISSNRLTVSNNSYIIYNTTLPANADYEVSVVGNIENNSNGSYLGVIARRTANDTFYLASYDNGNVRINKRISGVWTQLGSTGSFTQAASTDYTIKFVLSGTSLKAYINDVEKVNTTDSDITDKGLFAIYRGGGVPEQPGFYCDDYLVTGEALQTKSGGFLFNLT